MMYLQLLKTLAVINENNWPKTPNTDRTPIKVRVVEFISDKFLFYNQGNCLVKMWNFLNGFSSNLLWTVRCHYMSCLRLEITTHYVSLTSWNRIISKKLKTNLIKYGSLSKTEGLDYFALVTFSKSVIKRRWKEATGDWRYTK